MNPTDLDAYVDAALAMHGYRLSDVARTRVLTQFTLGAGIASAFLDVPLGPEDDMAPVFTPVARP